MRSAQASAEFSRALSRLQKTLELLADLGMAHAQLDARLQVAQLGAAVIALARKSLRQHALVREELGDAVGKLDFTSGAWGDFRQHVEDAGRQHVAPDDAEVRRGLGRLRFFDDAVDPREI